MCGCGCGQCDGGMLSGLMGQTLQQASDFPVIPGARFQFGYNIGYDLSAFAASELATVAENAGLSYDTISYKVAGWLNPFVTLEGASVLYWDSAVDFCNAVRNELQAAGYPLQVQTIQCNVENQSTEPGQAPQMTPVQRPAGGSGGTTQPPGQCNFDQMSFPDYVACEFGVGTMGTLLIGGLAVLIAVTLIKR